jgi:ribosome recycling factor
MNEENEKHQMYQMSETKRNSEIIQNILQNIFNLQQQAEGTLIKVPLNKHSCEYRKSQ